MKKSLDKRLRYAVENHKLNFEKFLGKGCKWYHHYLIVWELVWARNFCDGYQRLAISAKPLEQDKFKHE